MHALLVLLPTAALADWPDLSQPPADGADASTDAALIIAAEDYVFVADVPGARRNSDDWYQYLKHGRGVGTVKVLRDAEATRESILDAAEAISGRVAAGGTLWVVWIGHGAPAQDGQDGMLVGADVQQSARSVYARSVGQRELVDALEGQQANTVLVLDACFSGNTADGALVHGLQPMIPTYAVVSTPTLTILSAGKGDQFAGPLDDGSRPAFSYLVLGGLRGWADADGDGTITAREVTDYANTTIFETISDRRQEPQLSGPDLTLARGTESDPRARAETVVAPPPAAERAQRVPVGDQQPPTVAETASSGRKTTERPEPEPGVHIDWSMFDTTTIAGIGIGTEKKQVIARLGKATSKYRLDVMMWGRFDDDSGARNGVKIYLSGSRVRAVQAAGFGYDPLLDTIYGLSMEAVEQSLTQAGVPFERKSEGLLVFSNAEGCRVGLFEHSLVSAMPTGDSPPTRAGAVAPPPAEGSGTTRVELSCSLE